MQTLIFTGPASANALAAAATAAAAAAAGTRVLLASVGPSHPMAVLAGAPITSEPQPIAPGLDLWCLDPLTDLTAIWNAFRPGSSPPIAGDELPVIPGSDLFLATTRLRRFEQTYDLVCADVGPPETLLRALSTPDIFRWFVRLLVGLDRGPGRSSASVARAMIPATFVPLAGEWVGRIQDARVAFERLRDEMTLPVRTQVRYLFSPDRASLCDARLNVPALQLFGLAVECLVAGPVLPPSLKGSGLDDLIKEQAAVIDEAGTIWHGHAVYSLEAAPTPRSIAELADLGERLYGEDSPLPGPPPAPPVVLGSIPSPQVTLDLPGLPREALGLTLSGDELIVRAGPYRRHILLPEGLRGMTAIKASRQEELLVIKPRK